MTCINHRTEQAMRRAAKRAAGVIGHARERYSANTRTMEQLAADMMEDAKAVRAAFRENNHMPGDQVQSKDPTKVQQKIFDALEPKATAADVSKITGMSASNARHTLVALEKKGHVKRHPTNPLTWSKA